MSNSRRRSPRLRGDPPGPALADAPRRRTRRSVDKRTAWPNKRYVGPITPTIEERPPPPPAVFNAPADLHIRVYEGRAVATLQKHVAALIDRCSSYEWTWDAKRWHRRIVTGIANEYVSESFTGSSKTSAFALVATKAASGQVAGFIKGTVYSVHPNLHTQIRVLVLDLVCGQGRTPVKGVGPILMQEVERYARSIGVNLLLLFSVMRPKIVSFYGRMGFQRVLDACHPGSPANVRAQTLDNLDRPVSRMYHTAMRGAFYKDFDVPDDTVVMSKCLGTAHGFGTSRHVSYPAGRPNEGQLARYAKNDTRHLQAYGVHPNTRRLVRI